MEGDRALSAVAVSGLEKSYGSHAALRGIEFTIEPGEVFGLLGPNGAGKTTTVEILEGYRSRDAGTVEVLGADPERGDSAWRGRIGVMLQSSSLYPNLSVLESLRTFAGYYAAPRAPASPARSPPRGRPRSPGGGTAIPLAASPRCEAG